MKILFGILVIVALLVIATHDPIIPVQWNIKPEPECTGEYTLQPDDTITVIAVRCGCSTAEILQVNPQYRDAHDIQPGDTITFPGTGPFPGQAEACPQCSDQPESQPNTLFIPRDETHEYVVQPGDTLEEIAEMNGTDVESIRRLNLTLASTSKVYPGQILCMPEK